jgi:DNA-binding response OmpR family regulator
MKTMDGICFKKLQVFPMRESEVEMKRILVVDHDRGIQMLYEAELADEGYEVLTHGRADMLMRTIQQEKPDLVLMDLRLGGSDGLKLIERIRSSFDGMPVILSTAYPAFTLDPKLRAPDCFVEKSSDLTELKTKIKLILENGGNNFISC